MIRKDDRTPEQMATHHWLVIGTDRFMSGWGEAKNGVSIAAWACKPAHRRAVLDWVEARKDMKRVRESIDDGAKRRYRPSCAHLHIYLVDDEHPALDHLRRLGRV